MITCPNNYNSFKVDGIDVCLKFESASLAVDLSGNKYSQDTNGIWSKVVVNNSTTNTTTTATTPYGYYAAGAAGVLLLYLMVKK